MRQLIQIQVNWLVSFLISVVLLCRAGHASDTFGKSSYSAIISKLNFIIVLVEIKSGDWRFVQNKATICKLKNVTRITLGVKTEGVAHVFLLSDEILTDIDNYNSLTATIPDQTVTKKIPDATQASVTRSKSYIELVIGQEGKTMTLMGGHRDQFWNYIQLPDIDIITLKEYRYFWVEFNGSTIEVGVGDTTLLKQIEVAQLKTNFIVTHIGLSASSGQADWLLSNDGTLIF